MRLAGVEFRRVRMPLIRQRDAFAPPLGSLHGPLYSSEYVGGAETVLRVFLVPALAGLDHLSAERVGSALSFVKGHLMAKAALETAVLDAELRMHGVSLGDRLGAVRDRVPCGVSVGIMDSVPALLDAVGSYLAAGLCPHQAQDRARLGRGAGTRGSRAVRRHTTSGGREYGVHVG